MVEVYAEAVVEVEEEVLLVAETILVSVPADT